MRAWLAAGFVLALTAGAGARAQTAPDYAYGADIGWVTQEEHQGFTFHDATGHRADPFALLKADGINAIRLRVWVDPEGGWNGKVDTLAKARRAQAIGQRVMIDFHYSDNWADPGKQVKPKAWINDTEAQLEQHVHDHTVDVLSYLKANGIDVSWVQVGNEITNGLLWPDGDTKHWANLTKLTNSGYDAVKSVYPDARVVIHIDNGWDDAKAKAWFGNFFANGGKADIIGLSYYPAYSPSKDWKQENPHLGQTMADLVTLYHKPVMVVEIGFAADKPHEAKLMIEDVIKRNRMLDELGQGAAGLGVFYWEPDSPGPMGYPLGAMTDDGRFTAAMDAFKH
jgi:arabinogalactan endo-1,4-beta-galactosidase